jgi:hypothetical protein
MVRGPKFEVSGTLNSELRTWNLELRISRATPSSSKPRVLSPFSGVYGIGGSSKIMSLDPNVKKIALALIHLPRNFRDLENKSIYTLLKESGYFEAHDRVPESAIRDVLLDFPECVREWAMFSEDKRTSYGWFWRRRAKGRHEIGCQPKSGDTAQLIEYLDETDACAAFIKREVDEIMHGKGDRQNS